MKFFENIVKVDTDNYVQKIFENPSIYSSMIFQKIMKIIRENDERDTEMKSTLRREMYQRALHVIVIR